MILIDISFTGQFHIFNLLTHYMVGMT